ncbi:MAG: hypothetical protein ACJAWM_002183 [Sulfitobacter sp.]|jgi:hypothetical protein
MPVEGWNNGGMTATAVGYIKPSRPFHPDINLTEAELQTPQFRHHLRSEKLAAPARLLSIKACLMLPL